MFENMEYMLNLNQMHKKGAVKYPKLENTDINESLGVNRVIKMFEKRSAKSKEDEDFRNKVNEKLTNLPNHRPPPNKSSKVNFVKKIEIRGVNPEGIKKLSFVKLKDTTISDLGIPTQDKKDCETNYGTGTK